ncbi:ATPase family AAA domain-containing protein 3-B-like, partial [Trifolium medium]|nr:ATPase family AAA domain-containing protein 3-B-like [Trifolium medium]
MTGAEVRAHEARQSEEVNRRLLLECGDAEREKWISIINTTFEHIGAVGGVTALAAGVYTTREGARVIWGYVDRILGQPSFIRESSRGKYPWSGMFSRAKSTLSRRAGPESGSKNGKGIGLRVDDWRRCCSTSCLIGPRSPIGVYCFSLMKLMRFYA